MVEIDSLHLMALIEFSALLLVICLVIGVRAFLRSRREQAAIDKLVSAINEDKGRRQEETRRLLENRYGYSGDELQATGRRIARQELGFYQLLINLFIKRNTKALESLNIEYEGAVAPYRELGAPQGAESEVETEGEEETTVSVKVEGAAADNSAEIERLQRENKKLMAELETTMNTLSRMLNEYAGLVGDDKLPEDVAKAVEAVAGEASEETFDEIGDISLGAGEAVAETEAEAPGDIAAEDFDEIPDFDELLGVSDSPEPAAESAEEEPSWDEALGEQASAGESAEATPEAAEEEPSWDEALGEQASAGESAEATPEAAEEEPSWDEALGEQASAGESAEAAPETAEEEPSWDEALGEQASAGESAEAAPEAAEEEPSWDEALEEQSDKTGS